MEDFPEYINVAMEALDHYLRCQICLGIMTQVTAIKACCHRFCKDCIDKSIRYGNKECPLCRVPCPSHRSTIEDADFEAFIRHFLPYMDEEDYKLSEEDKSSNDQLQASYSVTEARQKHSNKKRNYRQDT